MYECVVLTLAQNTYRSPATPWVCLTLASTIMNNLYCTAMISYRIWESQRLLRTSEIGNMGARMRVSRLFPKGIRVNFLCDIKLTAYTSYLDRERSTPYGTLTFKNICLSASSYTSCCTRSSRLLG